MSIITVVCHDSCSPGLNELKQCKFWIGLVATSNQHLWHCADIGAMLTPWRGTQQHMVVTCTSNMCNQRYWCLRLATILFTCSINAVILYLYEWTRYAGHSPVGVEIMTIKWVLGIKTQKAWKPEVGAIFHSRCNTAAVTTACLNGCDGSLIINL